MLFMKARFSKQLASNESPKMGAAGGPLSSCLSAALTIWAATQQAATIQNLICEAESCSYQMSTFFVLRQVKTSSWQGGPGLQLYPVSI